MQFFIPFPFTSHWRCSCHPVQTYRILKIRISIKYIAVIRTLDSVWKSKRKNIAPTNRSIGRCMRLWSRSQSTDAVRCQTDDRWNPNRREKRYYIYVNMANVARNQIMTAVQQLDTRHTTLDACIELTSQPGRRWSLHCWRNNKCRWQQTVGYQFSFLFFKTNALLVHCWPAQKMINVNDILSFTYITAKRLADRWRRTAVFIKFKINFECASVACREGENRSLSIAWNSLSSNFDTQIMEDVIRVHSFPDVRWTYINCSEQLAMVALTMPWLPWLSSPVHIA